MIEIKTRRLLALLIETWDSLPAGKRECPPGKNALAWGEADLAKRYDPDWPFLLVDYEAAEEAAGLIADIFGDATADRFSSALAAVRESDECFVAMLERKAIRRFPEVPKFIFASDRLKTLICGLRDALAAGVLPPTVQTESTPRLTAPPAPQHCGESAAADDNPFARLKPVQWQAWFAYCLAAEALAERGVEQATYRAAFDWLKEHGPPDYKLPRDAETFGRYARAGKSAAGEGKNTPRAGRTGRSIAKLRDL